MIVRTETGEIASSFLTTRGAMRTNLPVTQQEHQFPHSETLLSTTDLESRITYANAAFVRTSGFETAELIGQPHNLVRHPDMPSEAFADMWRSLKAGESWTALVKNRRKNGDHYWVRANAVPMVRSGQVTGYLSVRTTPSRLEIETAEQLYRGFTDGTNVTLAFHRGVIVRKGIMAWTNALQLMPVAWRIRSGIGAFAAGMAGALYWGAGWGALLSPAGGFLVGSAVLTNWWLESQLSAPLGAILACAQQVATGESATELHLDRCDEIGMIARAIHQAGLNLQSLVADVHEQVSGIQSSSEEIAGANSNLSSRTEATASSLEETAASMEQQTATVQQNSESATKAWQLAITASEVAQKGGLAVSEVVATMGQISIASHKIADIISVVDGIAFQTNILALNAAVEAARAGEQGRGFAVVASEVRSLAGRSASAAREIKVLIDASVEEVTKGTQMVANAGVTITEVVDKVGHVNGLIAEITAASKEQALGILQVGQAVAKLDEMTQQNAAMVEESSATALNMREQAQRLMEAIEVFSRRRPG